MMIIGWGKFVQTFFAPNAIFLLEFVIATIAKFGIQKTLHALQNLGEKIKHSFLGVLKVG